MSGRASLVRGTVRCVLRGAIVVMWSVRYCGTR